MRRTSHEENGACGAVADSHHRREERGNRQHRPMRVRLGERAAGVEVSGHDLQRLVQRQFPCIHLMQGNCR